MDTEHVFDGEALALLTFGIEHNHNWVVYNTASYFLKKEDIYCFKHRGEAEEFCLNNISEFDVYAAIEADSLESAIEQITTGQSCAETQDRKERNRGDMDDLDMSRGKGHHI